MAIIPKESLTPKKSKRRRGRASPSPSKTVGSLETVVSRTDSITSITRTVVPIKGRGPGSRSVGTSTHRPRSRSVGTSTRGSRSRSTSTPKRRSKSVGTSVSRSGSRSRSTSAKGARSSQRRKHRRPRPTFGGRRRRRRGAKPKVRKPKPKFRPDGTRIKRRRKKKVTFSVYIYRILKSLDKSFGISRKGMDCLDSMVIDLYQRIATEGTTLAALNKKRTLQTAEVRNASRMIIAGNLGKSARKEGHNTLTNYLGRASK